MAEPTEAEKGTQRDTERGPPRDAARDRDGDREREEQRTLIALLTAQLREAGIQPAQLREAGIQPALGSSVSDEAARPLQWSPAAYCTGDRGGDRGSDAHAGSGLTREYAVSLVEEYGAAWMAQDEERITQIFTEDARYLEHPYDPKRTYAVCLSVCLPACLPACLSLSLALSL